MKAVKNEVELSGIRNAMLKDGIALVKFLKWLEYRWQTEKLDEVSIAEKLTEFRSMQDGFIGPSFETISGFNDHGAIVHYSADKETAYLLDKAGILLLDSGGQYLDGTTDITRVIVFGDAADNDARRDYTLVLKGILILREFSSRQGQMESSLILWPGIISGWKGKIIFMEPVMVWVISLLFMKDPRVSVPASHRQ